MSKKLQLHYECSNIPGKSFIIYFNDEKMTCKELLKIISKNQNRRYTTLLFQSSRVNDNDIITDYLKSYPNSVFYAIPSDDENTQSKISQNIISTPQGNKEQCIFYFTGSTIDHLLKGITVDLYTSMNPEQCHQELLQVLHKNKIDTTGKQLHIYLPGGIPFISGTLGDIFFNKNYQSSKVIYGVMTCEIKNSLLVEPILEICNISNTDRKSLISPLCDSSERGLSDISCLLGYLQHLGEKSDTFYVNISFILHFAPFINSMSNIINGLEVLGRDIATICSTLFTYFRGNLAPFKIPDDRLFEYTFKICNLISNIECVHDELPISLIDVNYTNYDFLNKFNFKSHVCLWCADFGFNFQCIDFDFKKNFEKDSGSINDCFSPISPLSMSFYNFTCKIV